MLRPRLPAPAVWDGDVPADKCERFAVQLQSNSRGLLVFVRVIEEEADIEDGSMRIESATADNSILLPVGVVSGLIQIQTDINSPPTTGELPGMVFYEARLSSSSSEISKGCN